MLYNIFKKQKTRKQKINKTPLIIADIHEKNSLILSELHKTTSIKLKITSLKIGDYLIGNTILERKTINDFISSMINKRLIQQLNQMQKYNQKILIIEGNLNELYGSKISKPTKGFILSIITKYNIPIIFTQNYKETSEYLIVLANQQLKQSETPTFHSRIPKKFHEQKSYVLESFPNIGPKKAKKLLIEFKTLKNIFNADKEKLKKILKNQTDSFKKLIEN